MCSKANLELNLEVDVLTTGSVAEVVIAVLELLLYQRNQIPFVYKTYKYYVDKWKEDADNIDVQLRDLEIDIVPTMQSLNVKAQRERATQTKHSIIAMRELIAEAFKTNTIKRLRFLFGSTVFTPIEAYTIEIPMAAISRTHSYMHHRIPQPLLNHTLINLLTSADLYSIFSTNLSPTNLFLEIEMLENSQGIETDITSKIIPKDFCELPSNCKDIRLHLVHMKPSLCAYSLALQCCKELEIFEDMAHLSLSQASDDTVKQDDTRPDMFRTAWWEAEIFIRGFKEKPIKSGNIWTQK